MTGSTIQSGFEAFDITFLAGRAGNGGINILNSSVSGGGGAITLGGFGTGLVPSGSFGSAAFSSTSAGVQITNSSVDAGTCCLGGGGTLTIRGASSGNFPGVSINSNILGATSLTARNTVIFGSTTGSANGVEFNDGTTATVPGSMTVEGVGVQNGVWMRPGSSISSSSTGGGGIVSLVGASTSNFSGVRLSGVITASNGNSVSISGANVAGSSAGAVLLLGANVTVNDPAGTLTLGIVNPAVDNDIIVNSSTLGELPDPS
jgi:hypothetical protein